jgi:hypothetical protein
MMNSLRRWVYWGRKGGELSLGRAVEVEVEESWVAETGIGSVCG